MSLYIKEIRGHVNSEITNEFASNLGNVVGNYVRSGEVVLIGRDDNPSSQMIKRAISSGIMSAGIDVFDFGIVPVPVIHYGLRLYNANAMVTVTSSHRDPADINIKIFSDHEIHLSKIAEKISGDLIGNLNYVHDYDEKYLEAVLDHLKVDKIRETYSKIVINATGGLMANYTPKILMNLDSETIIVGCLPQKLKKPAEPGPEDISLIQNIVIAIGADMGILLDNDRDRVLFIDEKGNLLKDQTVLGVFIKHILENNPNSTVVSSVVVSRAIDKIVSQYGGKLIKSPVAEVLNQIIVHKAIFGGDEPGIYVFPDFNQCFDAIYASIKMLEIICENNKPLSELTKEIPEYYRAGFQVQCEHDEKMQLIEKIKDILRDQGKINTTDGVRVDWEDSYVLLRPSRFEPLIRVYLEADSSKRLQELSEKIKKIIKNGVHPQ
jgi:phosphomannomutase